MEKPLYSITVSYRIMGIQARKLFQGNDPVTVQDEAWAEINLILKKHGSCGITETGYAPNKKIGSLSWKRRKNKEHKTGISL